MQQYTLVINEQQFSCLLIVCLFVCNLAPALIIIIIIIIIVNVLTNINIIANINM